ncbi:MAG TPA: hypothetical protein PKD37_00260 [Oligoflexia bacterium]|nr:hypothetical protein [Oligoflexia bacterium]HMP26413.1 hypothetical protein [Oligoflexia bacterium]
MPNALKTASKTTAIKPKIIPRHAHSIARQRISQDALKVMMRLNEHGFKAHLVGGAVRDLLLNKRPKDFDVCTDARPRQIQKLFRNSRIIGRRFKLVQVYYSKDRIIQVSTFRDNAGFLPMEIEENQDREDLSLENLRNSENVYGTEETDALRRDLTINGLFYDLRSYSIIDYVGGWEDLQNKTIRVIGDPRERFAEDPVRLLRVLRHSARTGFKIEEQCYNALLESSDLILKASAVRVYDELKKDMLSGSFAPFLNLMRSTGILGKLIPQTAQTGAEWLFYERFFIECDKRVVYEQFKDELVMLAGLVIYSLIGSSDFRGRFLKELKELNSKEGILQALNDSIGNLFMTRRAKDEIIDLIKFIKDTLQGIERDQSLKGLKARKIADLAHDFFSVLAIAGGDYFTNVFARLKQDCQWK